MVRNMSIFTSFLMVIFMFSAFAPVDAANNNKLSGQSQMSGVNNCATSHQLRTLSGHEKDHLRYLCGNKLTIRDAINAIDKSEIYYDDKRRDGFLVRFPGELIFENGSANVPDNSMSTIRKFADVIRDYDNAVTVNGHASTPNIDTIEYPSNQVLSEVRAKNVADYMMNYQDVDSQRLLSRGYGDNFPHTVEINDATERLNRRVDFFVKY